MTDSREIEAKFEIDDPTPLFGITTAPPLVAVARRQSEQVDTYFDTATARLREAGSTLRLRESGGVWTMTFKGRRALTTEQTRHIASRVEVNERVDADFATTMIAGHRPPGEPAPLKMAEDLTGADSLSPVARIHNTRTAIDLVDDAKRRYELAVDRCRGIRLADGRVVEFGEVELEASAADHDALLRAAAALRAAVPALRPSGQTKLARVLG